MTFFTRAVLITVTFSLAVAGGKTSAQTKQVKRTADTIHVSTLSRARVIGVLGWPLGEIVTIEGIASDGAYTKKKSDMGAVVLRIRTVNGKPLKSEIVLHFLLFHDTAINTPSAGTEFKYVGYETGEYAGVPEKAFNYVPRAATTHYGFTTSFVVLRDERVSR